MKLALIRVDGDSIRIGMGHIIREIDIAQELQKRNYKIIFIIKDYIEAISYIDIYNFKVIKLKKNENENTKLSLELSKIINSTKNLIDIIIIDLLIDFNKNDYFNTLKKFCKKLVVISDNTKSFYVRADIVFALSPNQDISYYKDIVETKYFTGLNYFPLKKDFQNVEKKYIRRNVSNILITFGGTDGGNYSTRVVKMLKNKTLSNKPILIIGPGFSKTNYENLLKILNEKVKLKRNVVNIKKYFMNTDLCICSAGNSLIELLTCGVPCIVIPQTKRENEHASTFEERGFIINLGLNWNEELLYSRLKELSKNYKKRKKLSEYSQKFFDGKGLSRMIEEIIANQE